MRIRLFAAAIAAIGILTATGFATADNGEKAASSVGNCIGLTCVKSGSQHDVPQARSTVSRLSGPGQLAKQTRAGFYEFGRGTSVRKRAVAYVVPYGQRNRMPASVRDLPVVRAIEKPAGRANDFDVGTVVIFEPGVSLLVARDETAARATASSHVGPGEDQYGCADNYFCLYDCSSWSVHGSTCREALQLGREYRYSGWRRLSDFGFNDKANSMRNRRDRDSWLARDIAAGTGYCADSHSSDTTFGNNPIGNNEASSFMNSVYDHYC